MLRKTARAGERLALALALVPLAAACKATPFTPTIRSEELDRAESALDRGEVGDAIGILKGRVGESMRGLKLLGRAHMALREYEPARDAYATATRLEPHDIDAWISLAAACEGDRYFELALDCYRKALEREPRNEELMRRLALLLADLGRLSEAAPALRRALEVAPGDEDVRMRLGAVELARGRAGEAEAAFDEVLRRAKDPSPTALVGRGLARAQQGKNDAAVADLEKACSLARDDPDPPYNLGWIQEEKLGNRDAAEASYREALRRDASHANATIRLAGVLREGGHRQEALAFYRRALTLPVDPRMKGALRSAIDELERPATSPARL